MVVPSGTAVPGELQQERLATSALAKTDPVSLAKNDPVGDLNLRGDW
jgi:hypothetical protein